MSQNKWTINEYLTKESLNPLFAVAVFFNLALINLTYIRLPNYGHFPEVNAVEGLGFDVFILKA